MGYRTDYRLEVWNADATSNETEKFCIEYKNECAITGRDIAEEISEDLKYLIDTTINEDYTDEMKWYDNQRDMCEFSIIFPNYVFILEGKGEESEDIWKAYFLNGKIQPAPARIVYDDFDPSKLVELT